MPNLEAIIRSIDRLEPISPIAVEVVGLLDNDEYRFMEVANLVSQDPALAANVLRMVNSAYYGLKCRTNTIRDALALLGARRMAELILMFSLNQTYNAGCCRRTSSEGGHLWHTAVVTANLSREISKLSGIGNPGRIFTAALVRDIGKIVIDQFAVAADREIRDVVEAEGIGLDEAEQRVLGIGHAELGARVAESWGFPGSIVRIIRNHHREVAPDGADDRMDQRETSIVRCAEEIYLRFEGGEEGAMDPAGCGAAASFLTEAQFHGLMYTLMRARLDLRLFLDEMHSSMNSSCQIGNCAIDYKSL